MNPKKFALSLPLVLAGLLVVTGMGLRVYWMNQSALWCDEAESSINALTILQTGVPGSNYLGLPVYENTLSEPWEGHPEYEFRDSSYSFRQGVAVYHGWLPLYAIALSQWAFGMTPDSPSEPPRVLHTADEIDRRTTIPRLPALVFSFACLVVIARLGWAIGGPTCGLGVLTLMALNARTVDFGFQARYYSATLFMTALAAWFLWLAATRGKWRDYLLLGLGSALLFHTHLFSLLVFSVAALAAVPFMARRRGWWIRAGCGAALAGVLVLPWVVLSGFLETADSVPKVFHLFDGPWDALAYALDRPLPLLILGILIVAVVAARFCPGVIHQLLGPFGERLGKHAFLYAFLLFWMVVAYAAFHLLVPAASFFFERLSLVLWIPFVLLLGLLVSDLLHRLDENRAVVLAVLIMIALLAIRGRLAFLEETSISRDRNGVAELAEVLASREFQPGTRFYATPNDHLTWTYYTGLPVQSVAPVRREFFATYPDPVIFIESQMDAMFPAKADIEEVLLAEGMPLSPGNISSLKHAVWRRLAGNDLKKRGLFPPEEKEILEFSGLDQLRQTSESDFARVQKKYLRDIQALPTFRGLPVSCIKDIWLGFFYRFVNPAERLGENFNLLSRMRESEIEFLPEAEVVLYFSNEPPRVPGSPNSSSVNFD